MEKLTRLKTSNCINLRDDVEDNFDRYLSTNFVEIVDTADAISTLALEINLESMAQLIPSSGKENEAHNSKIVFEALPGMTPRLARDEGIWTYLCHGPCLNFVRERWLKDVAVEELESVILTHFFANTLTRCRDDNGIARMWWNGHVASLASPGDIDKGLDAILTTADIRSNLVERPQITSWPRLCQGIVRHMQNDKWLTSKELHFREFMKQVNFLCGGVLLEGLSEKHVDELLVKCIEHANASVRTAKSRKKVKSRKKSTVRKRKSKRK